MLSNNLENKAPPVTYFIVFVKVQTQSSSESLLKIQSGLNAVEDLKIRYLFYTFQKFANNREDLQESIF